jgi:nucleoside-diphosphate-sugar epimerase
MKDKHNILVIGGTGKTGRKVASKLTALGHNVRIGSRNASPKFDWDNSETWMKAMQHNNPVQSGFVTDPVDWKYSSARNYQDDQTVLEIDTNGFLYGLVDSARARLSR